MHIFSEGTEKDMTGASTSAAGGLALGQGEDPAGAAEPLGTAWTLGICVPGGDWQLVGAVAGQ